jgi:hypothetical protein
MSQRGAWMLCCLHAMPCLRTQPYPLCLETSAVCYHRGKTPLRPSPQAALLSRAAPQAQAQASSTVITPAQGQRTRQAADEVQAPRGKARGAQCCDGGFHLGEIVAAPARAQQLLEAPSKDKTRTPFTNRSLRAPHSCSYELLVASHDARHHWENA